jgi:transketolase
MKQTFIDTLTQLMRRDKKLVTVTADMGFSVYENMQKEFPDRFINTGVTEQASASFSAGLALTGHKVFYYAQAAFVTMRCFEQVRLDIGYNNLDIKLIGVNAGFGLNQLGVSHFAQEDVALMRTIPGMTVLTPATPFEMKWAVRTAYTLKTPVYIRYSKLTHSDSQKKLSQPVLGEPRLVQPGKDILILASGGILQNAYEALPKLKEKNISAALYSMPTLKPINKRKILTLMKKFQKIYTVEEHTVIGGLYSAIAEIAAETGSQNLIIPIGIQDSFTSVTGSIPYLLDINGLSPDKIYRKIVKTFPKSA